ncbi:DNA (cytosine-5-)-methyltransferase [bacterium (Candidatus Howlettbacteria) CG_4_10_14_0_8_um_filter_40_9]|nr:MAG: DNA (cytosine-5-)-methyltransferase [bacterium (Candidatus Howlettbacteria) CG_4_10_14_0_8_um_filter_40_9]
MHSGLRTIDLFAGIGGVRIGFEKAGFETVFANDFDSYCKITYDLNFSRAKLTVADIAEVRSEDLPKFDLLLGGFPCQPFSIAGLRKGFEDEGRGNLFFEIERILKDRKPRAFLLENVKNLQSHDDGRTYRFIKERIQELGYFVQEKVLNSMEYGNVPQNRERIYIVGFLSEEAYDRFEFPDKTPLTTTIKDILDKEADEKYYYNGKPLYEKLKDEVISENTVYQWRRKYVRANKKGVCPTLTANMGTGGHNVPIIRDHKGIRKLTPKECSRIQGFPEYYKLPDIADSRLYKQIGNSVTTTVIEKVALQISSALEYKYQPSKITKLVPQTIS